MTKRVRAIFAALAGIAAAAVCFATPVQAADGSTARRGAEVATAFDGLPVGLAPLTDAEMNLVRGGGLSDLIGALAAAAPGCDNALPCSIGLGLGDWIRALVAAAPGCGNALPCNIVAVQVNGQSASSSGPGPQTVTIHGASTTASASASSGSARATVRMR